MPYLILFLVALLWLQNYSSLDPDFGWHLSLGKEMIANKSLIHSFVGYNYFGNLHTIDHQWLSDILLYLIHYHVGYWFLALIFFLITLTIFWLLYRLILLHKVHSTIAGLIIALSVLSASLVFYGVRLQYLLLLAAVLLPYIFKTVRPFWQRLIYYFLIFALGSNLHGGFLTLAPIPFLLEISILKFDNENRKKSFRQILYLILILIAAFSTNPYGIEYWKFIIGYWTSPYYRSHISEWLPITAFPLHWAQVIFPLSITIFLITIDKYWKKINKFKLALLALYLYLGITSLRAFPIFILLAAPYIAVALQNLLASLKLNVSNAKYFLIAFVLIISVCWMAGMRKIDFRTSVFDADHSYPENALSYLSENISESGNLLNDYGWGGYQIWTHPELKVFIDGRNPIPFVDGKKSMLEVYDNFYYGSDEKLANNLTKYNISTVMMNKPVVYRLNKAETLLYINLGGLNLNDLNKAPDLIKYLDSNSNWKRIYTDDHAYIWQRLEQ